FVEVPPHLVAKDYANKLAGDIDRNRATPSRRLAKEIQLAPESEHPTHFSVVDGNGMAVSNTYTLEQSFGSRVVVRGGGFLLKKEMGNLNPELVVRNDQGQIGPPANIVAPGKRRLSSMTPVIVTTPDGKLLLVTGSPGG